MMLLREQSAAGVVSIGNVGSLTSHNPIGLHGLLRGQSFFLFSLALDLDLDLYPVASVLLDILVSAVLSFMVPPHVSTLHYCSVDWDSSLPQ
jgi:hypothetical protein